VKPIVIDPKKELVVRNSAGLLQPLRVPAFRNLLIADLVSDVGTFMQSVGAAWLMVSLHAGPGYVALIQTAASLPYFLLALPAGSAGDIFDRRRLILFTEVWMMGAALILFALLPSVARSVDERAIGYGLLLGCFGAGAIGGALLMQMTCPPGISLLEM